MFNKYIEELRNEANKNNIDISSELTRINRHYRLGIEAGLTEKEIVEMLPKFSDICKNKTNQLEEDIYVKKNEFYLDGLLANNVNINLTDENGISIDIDKEIEQFYDIEIYDDRLMVKCKKNLKNVKENGDITININKYFYFEKIKLIVVSADLFINGILRGDDISIKTVSGDINVDKLISKTNVVFDSVSGDCNIKELVSENLKINTISGDFKIDKIKVIDSKVNSVSGDLNLTGEIKNIKANSISGSVIYNEKSTGSTLNEKIKKMVKGFRI